jgi:exopolysaccharide biosynthesis operon protein EpsL
MASSDSGSSQRAAGASGSAALSKKFLAAALAAGLAPCSSWALFGDRVELWVAENVTHDSNVLRLSKNLSTLPGGATQRGDTIYSTHFGATVNATFSQQHVTAEYNWFKSQYRNFKDFDFNGHTARADWQWVANPGFKGTLGASENQGLASFANIQSRDPDLVTSRSVYATGNWMATPRYRASAGLLGVQTRHSSAPRKVNDIDLVSGELGLSYVTPLDNSVGVVSRYENGRIPNGLTVGGLPFDNSYRQYGVGVMTTWIFTGHSRFDGRVEVVNRKYEQASQRNYSGPILKAQYTWTPTGKLTVLASLSRDVGPAEDIQTSFVLVTGGYVRPRWALTDKITLQGNVEYNVWQYRGDPLLGLNTEYHVRTFGGSITYRPFPKVLLQAGINREVRTATIPLADYEVDVAFVEGRVGF